MSWLDIQPAIAAKVENSRYGGNDDDNERAVENGVDWNGNSTKYSKAKTSALQMTVTNSVTNDQFFHLILAFYNFHGFLSHCNQSAARHPLMKRIQNAKEIKGERKTNQQNKQAPQSSSISVDQI